MSGKQTVPAGVHAERWEGECVFGDVGRGEGAAGDDVRSGVYSRMRMRGLYCN